MPILWLSLAWMCQDVGPTGFSGGRHQALGHESDASLYELNMACTIDICGKNQPQYPLCDLCLNMLETW